MYPSFVPTMQPETGRISRADHGKFPVIKKYSRKRAYLTLILQSFGLNDHPQLILRDWMLEVIMRLLPKYPVLY